MTPALSPARVTTPLVAYLRDLLLLSKPRLSGLVMITCAGGMWLAPGNIEPARAALAVLATAAVVGAANALNCYLERDLDARMRRTRDRPLPAGRLDPLVALGLGVLVSAFAIPVLALAAGRLPAFLALLALATYVLGYTPLKRRTPLALFVGAVPGAIPPALGWATVTGRLEPGGLSLFALLFAWQIPHFLAVSLYLEDDYARAGLPVFAIAHGRTGTRRAILATTGLLLAVSLFPVAAGLVEAAYAAVAGMLGAGLMVVALRGVGRANWARRFFLATLAYLTALFVALVLFRR